MTKLLVVDPDTEITTLIQTFFSKEGFEVFVAHTGQAGLKLISEAKPDILLLEINLPDMSLFDFIPKLHEGLLQHSNITLLMEPQRDISLLGDFPILTDLIFKPFEIEELHLRIKNELWRADRLKYFDPITDLMYWQPFEERMWEALQRPKWTYIDLKITYFGAFNEIYTYATADDVLRFLSTLILETVKQFGTTDDIAGHPQRNNLVLLTYANEPVKLVQCLVAQFNERVKEHYAPVDRERGYTTMPDEEQKFPLMTLAAGWVSWSEDLQLNLREIVDFAIEDRRRRSGQNTIPPDPISW